METSIQGSRLDFLCEEMGKSEFGDTRLSERLVSMVREIARKPGESSPQIFPDEASLEAAYRFLRNPTIRPEKILAVFTYKHVGEKALVTRIFLS